MCVYMVGDTGYMKKNKAKNIYIGAPVFKFFKMGLIILSHWFKIHKLTIGTRHVQFFLFPL